MKNVSERGEATAQIGLPAGVYRCYGGEATHMAGNLAALSWPAGWLPLGVLLAGWIAVRLGSLMLPAHALHLRLVGAAVWGNTFVVVSSWLLAAVGCFKTPAVLGAWAAVALLLAGGPRRRPRPMRYLSMLRLSAWLPVGLTVLALSIAAMAAYVLPIWHWDSLGYHLPYVNFLLQDGGLRGVPKDVHYLSTYPHAAELVFGALRLLLPDDRLVDLGQIPFGLIGAVGIASIARSLEARVADAIVAGCVWLTIPAVFLQLPTNYVDVAAAAAFLLAGATLVAPLTTPILLTSGAAIGLYLGTKPSAPLGAALLSIVLIVRSWKQRKIGWAAVGLGLALLIGGEAYLTNLLRHGNPIWPVSVHLGPLTLPGEESLDKLLSSGAGTYQITGTLPWRVVRSWTSLTAPPMFDMRVGGFGPLLFVALPVGLFSLAKTGRWWASVLLVASIAAPDPALARYVLSFPGLLLAFAAALPARVSVSKEVRGALDVGVALIAGWNIVYAFPALTGEGPPLLAYARMTWKERLQAVGAEGRPTVLISTRSKLAPGEGSAFDKSMDFPYLLWNVHATNRVVRVPDRVTQAEVEDLLGRENVKLVGAGPSTPLGRFVQRKPNGFNLFYRCKSSDCAIYWRQ